MKTLVLAAGLLTALAVGSQWLDAKPQDEGMPPMPQPGEQHRLMAKSVGEWDAVLSFETPIGPLSSRGTESVEMFGPFYQVSTFKGDVMGSAFEGRAQMGYDPGRDQWTVTWIDTMSPAISIMVGDYDAETKTFTFLHDGDDGSGTIVDMKTVIAYQSDDAHTHTMYVVDDEGNESQQMHIAYTRAKADGMR